MVLPYKNEDNGEIGAKNISELLDVDLTNLANGEVLKYNSTNDKWENGLDGGLEGQNLYNNFVLKYDTGVNKVVNTSLLEEYTASSSKISFYPTDGLLSVFAGKIEAQYLGGQKKIRISTDADSIDKGITIDNTGRVGIGLSDPTEDLELAGNIQLDTGGVQRSRVIFYDKQNDHEHAEIDGLGDGTNGGSLAFYTKDDGGSVTEKLRINQVGAIGIGGENFGKSGQILTSQGYTTKPKWNYSTNSLYAIQLGQNIDGEADNDRSGTAISTSYDGFRVAIGAHLHEGAGGFDSGHVKVFEYDEVGLVWNQLGQTIEDETTSNAQSGFSVSMSNDGLRLAVGARNSPGGGSFRGCVRVYEYDEATTTWVQLGSNINGEANSDNLGFKVAISGDGSRVAAGAPFNDDNGNNSGHARIYEYDGSAWNQLGGDIDGEAADDQAHRVSLSYDGSIVAVGSRYNDGNGSSSGHARIYEYDGTKWNQLGSDIDGEAADDLFGWSVSLSADGLRLAVSAYLNDGGGSNSGHVRVFEYDGSVWNQLGGDIDGEVADERFGYSVSLSADGTKVASGAQLNDGNGTDSGVVRVYEYDGSSWVKIIKNIYGDAGDQIGVQTILSGDGNVVAFSGDRAGAGGTERGRTRIYKLADAKEAIEYCLANL